MPISQPDPQAIFNVLVLKKRRLEFWLPPEETKKPEQPENTAIKGKGKAKAKTAKANPEASIKETTTRRTRNVHQQINWSAET